MRSLIFLLMLFAAQNSICQSLDEDGIRQHAFGISRFDTIDGRVAEIFKNQKLILIGEMHGTAESARFVEYLVKNLRNNGRKVYVGLEISPQDLIGKEDSYDSIALSNTAFFSHESYGKASKAWLHLIMDVSQFNDVEPFCFDLTKKQLSKSASLRDSLMYINIKTKMLKDTGGIYICLCGNAHNKLSGRRFPVPMGYYFLEDKALNLSTYNMVSFNHLYVEGGANCDTGDGTRLHTLKDSDRFYTLTGLRKYFSFTHQLLSGDYNGVLFTYHVSPSFGLR